MKSIKGLVISLALVGTLLGLAACGAKNTDKMSKDEPLSGGWSPANSSEVTDEITELITKATDGLQDVSYTPIAYLGSQVVAGTNHAILCKTLSITPNAEATNVILYIYEDLDGKATILGYSEIPDTIDIKKLDEIWKLVIQGIPEDNI